MSVSMSVPITTFYAAILGIFFIFLSIRTIHVRRKLKIIIGDAGNNELQRIIRAHANFSEYVPIGMFLILLVEIGDGYAPFIHFLGLCLIIGRLLHAFGVSRSNENFKFRVLGMSLTFTTIMVSSLYLLYAVLSEIIS